MLRAERARYILDRLQELYPETPVPLDHKDPFTLLVAVLLSAQCTDERKLQELRALDMRHLRQSALRNLQWVWAGTACCLEF